MSDSDRDRSGSSDRRPDRLRPRTRPVRHRAPRRHAPRHPRLAGRRPTGHRPRRHRPGHPPDLARDSTTTTRCPATTRSRSRAPASSAALRTPAHFQREIGKTVTVRLADIVAPTAERSERRLHGVLDRRRRAHRHDPASSTPAPTERVGAVRQIDRAKTVFVWGPAPKPGKSGAEEAKPRDPKVNRSKRRPIEQEGDATVMSNLDMSEAIRLLAQEKGLSDDALLHVLVDALATAYKRRPAPPTRSSSRSTRRRWSSRSSPTTSTRTATGSTSATTPRRRKSSAASPPRPSAR